MLVIIPDVHHDWDWVQQIIQLYDEDARYLFLGDYVDYKRTFTYDHLESCALLKECMDQLGSRATWLMGNHDVQYHPLNKKLNGLLSCAGRQRFVADQLEATMPWDKMQVAATAQGWLFTHAGLADFDDLEQQRDSTILADLVNRHWKQMVDSGSAPHPYLIGFGWYTGGNGIGGPFWHRPQEAKLIAVNQMCGHTPQDKPTDFASESNVTRAQHWHLDCMQTYWAELDESSPAPRFRS